MLGPDLFPLRAPARARDGRGRFAKGHSGNPKGRPRGIPNPKRRLITLQAWRANREAALAVAKRRPWLLRPLLAQVLPPPARPLDPAERLGISVEALSNAADFQQALQTVLAAVAAGAIAPREAGRIARRIRTRMRALRRLARFQRRLARLGSPESLPVEDKRFKNRTQTIIPGLDPGIYAGCRRGWPGQSPAQVRVRP